MVVGFSAKHCDTWLKKALIDVYNNDINDDFTPI